MSEPYKHDFKIERLNVNNTYPLSDPYPLFLYPNAFRPSFYALNERTRSETVLHTKSNEVLAAARSHGNIPRRNEGRRVEKQRQE